MYLVASVCNITQKNRDTLMNLSGNLRNGLKNKRLDFGDDLDHRMDRGIFLKILYSAEIRIILALLLTQK